MTLEAIAAMIERDGIIQRSAALLQCADDLLKLGKRRLEAHRTDVIRIHEPSFGGADKGKQGGPRASCDWKSRIRARRPTSLLFERVLDPGDDLVADQFLAARFGLRRGDRRLGVAHVLLALGPKLLD